MFAPHHQATADELVRVCRPGGTIGLISWTPAGFIGQMFATMKPYAPPPPPGAQPPPLWGDQAHVTALLGDRVEVVQIGRASCREGDWSSDVCSSDLTTRPPRTSWSGSAGPAAPSG